MIPCKNKTTHPISSNNHHSATANKQYTAINKGAATKPTGIYYNLDKV